MGTPVWGKEVLKKQEEHSAALEQLNVKVEEHDAFHADLMAFLRHQFDVVLRQQFDDMRRHFDVTVENIRSDNRAFGEQLQAHTTLLKNHSPRIEQLESGQQVVNAAVRGLSNRVGALETSQDARR